MQLRRLILLAAFFICATAHAQTAYDVVIQGGRVIDPETGLDAVTNIGIVAGHVAEISNKPLKGKEVINAQGLVVAPGFIDLHVHGRSNKEQEYQLHDGITTALELEWGIEQTAQWYASRQSKALIHYGASVCWPFERFRAMKKYEATANAMTHTGSADGSRLESLFNTIGASYLEAPTAEEHAQTLVNIRQSLREGAVGIGVPVGYLPRTKSDEIYRVFQLAGEMKTLVFSHVRDMGLLSIQEVIADAALTGASLHVVHVNSMALGDISVAIGMIDAAKSKGIDVTTEVYPYTAASTLLQSAIFNDGWREKLGMDYGDLQWVATGERLTQETFATYRKAGGTAIMHMMKPEWIKTGIAAPGVMVASDGMAYSPLAHPRTAGTFTRVLGKYVREEKALTLPQAVEKMTLLPARRLESVAPGMRFKGRIQVGTDADITIFDPATVKDEATFEKGLAFSSGISYVLVNGTVMLRNGRTVPNVFPGQPVFGKFKQ